MKQKEVDVPSSMPDYLDGWEDAFEIPKHYGNDTVMTQLHMGLITDSVKNHIVQEVCTYFTFYITQIHKYQEFTIE